MRPLIDCYSDRPIRTFFEKEQEAAVKGLPPPFITENGKGPFSPHNLAAMQHDLLGAKYIKLEIIQRWRDRLVVEMALG